jgi:DNA polymerase-3 subunit epsilon
MMNLNKKSIAMVFDVETTGLLNSRNADNLELCPWVLQCSYILYDVENLKIIKTMNSYVKIPDEVNIPAESTAIHGITRAQCDAGRSMQDILTEFYTDYHNHATVLVAHNYKFDTTLLNIELRRNWPLLKETCPFALNLFHPDYMRGVNMANICTMDSTRNLCKIEFPVNGKTSYAGKAGSFKWPTLLELYRHLFDGETPENLHDSMMDCLVCLRCLLKVSGEHDIETEEFAEMVMSEIVSL